MGDIVNWRRNERTLVGSIVASSQDRQQCQRAQALQWLDDGESVDEVASRLYRSRQTIYNWILRAQAESEQSLAQRLADAPRSGRPPTAQGIIDPLIESVRHPPRSGWLDEWGRLKGGHPSLLSMTGQQGNLEHALTVRVLILLVPNVRAYLF